ncbi:MAG: hypothetical protein R3B68_01805 [Phycisphaerales bacterium]
MSRFSVLHPPLIAHLNGCDTPVEGETRHVLTSQGTFQQATARLEPASSPLIAVFTDGGLRPLVLEPDQFVLAGEIREDDESPVLSPTPARSLTNAHVLAEPADIEFDEVRSPMREGHAEIAQRFVATARVAVAPTSPGDVNEPTSPLLLSHLGRRRFVGALLELVEFLDPESAVMQRPAFNRTHVGLMLPSQGAAVMLRLLLNTLGVDTVIVVARRRVALLAPLSIARVPTVRSQRLREHLSSRGLRSPAQAPAQPVDVYALRPISSVREESGDDRWVWRLDVAHDHSYTMQGVIIFDRTRTRNRTRASA